MFADDKPGVRELVGVAMNASALVVEINPARPEATTAADRIIALGFAGAQMTRGRAGDGEAVRLSSLLLRRREGGDATVTTECGVLLATRVMRHELKRRKRVEPNAAFDLAARMLWTILGVQVVREWCHDRCTECGGIGRVQLMARGAQVPVRSERLVRGARAVQCGGCSGTGFARTSGPRRAKMLGISMADYDRVWHQRFVVAALELSRVAPLIEGPLQSALKRA